MSSILDAVTKDAQRSGKIPDADGQPPRDPGKGGGRFRSTAIVVVLGLLIGAGASRLLGGSDEAVEDDLLTDKVASRAKTSTPAGEGPVAPADAEEIAVAAKPPLEARGKGRKDVAPKEDREKADAKGGRRADRKDEQDRGHGGDQAKGAGAMPATAPPSPVAPPQPAAPPPPVVASTSVPAPAVPVAPVPAPAAVPVVAAPPPVAQPTIPAPSVPAPIPSAPATAPVVTATKKAIPPPAPIPPAAPVPSPSPALVAKAPAPAPAAPPASTAPTQVASVSPPVVAAPAAPAGTAASPPPPPSPVVPIVAKPVAPPVPPPAVKPAPPMGAPPPPPSPAVVDQAFRSVVADEVAPAAPPARPLLEAKPEGAPEVFILFVAWSKKPAERLVSMRVGTGPLNVVHEGESVEGLQIATIHPESVDLVWTGRAYRVPMREF